MNALTTLNFEHQQFAVHYVQTRNASLAYHLTYPDAEPSTCGSRGSELSRDPLVAGLIKKYQDMLAEDHEVSAHRLIEELKKSAFSDILDIVKLKKRGTSTVIRLRSEDEIPFDARGAISEISRGKDGAFKVKMHSKLDAQKMLGTTVGLFTEKVDVNVNVTHDLTDAARETLERVKKVRAAKLVEAAQVVQ